MKVLKFGGTSLATAESIRKVVDIIDAENAEIIVVSAPGRRFAGDKKVTDLLLDCYNARLFSGKCDVPFFEVEQRIIALAESVGVVGIKPYLDQIRHDINGGASMGYTMSRGEYLCALIMRHLLSCELVDAASIIRFDANGHPDYPLSYQKILSRLAGTRRAVIPGFYGATASGEIKTFSRGGSDVTGAVVAAGLGADVYQNWTDVNGVYFSPLIARCGVIPALSFDDMRQLSYLGASVLHPASILPLMEKSVPLRIKNTFCPNEEGTFVGFFDKAERTLSANTIACSENGLDDDPQEGLGIACGVDSSVLNSANTASLGAVESLSDNNVLAAGVVESQGGSESMPLAVAGRGGFKLFRFYKAGGSDEDYFFSVVESCRKKGARIFTAVCGVDNVSIVVEGNVEGLEGVSEDIAVIAVVGGEKKRIIADISNSELPISFLQADFGGKAVNFGVPLSQLEAWLEELCRLFYRGQSV